MDKLVAVILTFNSQKIITETVNQALKLTKSIFIVDSFSTDKTLEIVKDLGCEIISRKFDNYADQRNWAIGHLSEKFEWQIHLDSDEILDDKAIASIKDALEDSDNSAYLIRRKHYFMGSPLHFSGINAWHLRIFKSGTVICEDRLYDQHFIGDVKTKKLKGFMHDKNDLIISEWISRHNRWSDLEVEELSKRDSLSNLNQLRPKIFGDSRERTRFLKHIYYRLPPLFRAVSYFFYRYFLRLAFLDGRAGFYFTFFQALWFRILIDLKLSEHDNQ